MWKIKQPKYSFSSGSVEQYPRKLQHLQFLESQNLAHVKKKLSKTDIQRKVGWNNGDEICAVHYAAAKSSVDVLRLVFVKLSALNIDINNVIAENKGWNCLHFAVNFTNQLSVIEELCNRGVLADRVDKKDGYTPMMLAIEKNNLGAVKILYEHSDLTVKNNSEHTSRELARMLVRPPIERFFDQSHNREVFNSQITSILSNQDMLTTEVKDLKMKQQNQEQVLTDHENKLKFLMNQQQQQQRMNRLDRSVSTETLDSGITSCKSDVSAEKFDFKVILRENYVDLIQQIRGREIIHHLYQSKIIDLPFKDLLYDMQNMVDQNRHIVDYLIKGQREWFEEFLLILPKVNQQHLVDMLIDRNFSTYI